MGDIAAENGASEKLAEISFKRITIEPQTYLNLSFTYAN